ncbi:MAG: biosynthetic-type acetolactate synthase large subunit [Candidatus Melainabacteria bacterium]
MGMTMNPTTETDATQAQSQPSTERGARKLKGSEVMLECLVEEGVDTIFGYPGGVVLSLYDYLPNYPIKHYLVRHEQGATHAAEGYARATGKPGVVLVTSGPGATNTITGIADAYYDSIPLVVFTGNVPKNLLGSDAFQEADIVSMTRACTKHNICVRDITDLPAAIKEAFHVATTGRPGPVLVDIPKDVLTADLASLDYSQARIDLPGYQNLDTFTGSDLDAALELIKNARQPLLLAGGGVVSSGAHRELLAIAERLKLPVACSLMGLGGFPANHPQFIGFCGMHGWYWANIAIANADVLVIVGNRLNERQTGKPDRFARNARIIHIDLDPTTLDKVVQSALPIQGNIPTVLNHLLARTEDMTPFADSLESRGEWLEKINDWKNRRTEKDTPPEGFLCPEYVIERVFANMPEDGIVATEVGQHQMWAAQRYNLNRPRSFITSGGLGTMGFGFPAAIGAQVACPDKLVVDIAGDGSFQMTLQELACAVDYNLPVKVAIINNNYLGMIRQWQGRFFRHESEARMSNPDYVKLAEAYGAKGFVVNHPDEVDSTLQAAFAHPGPVLIDFRVHRESDVYPWVPGGAGNEDMLLNKQSKVGG